MPAGVAFRVHYTHYSLMAELFFLMVASCWGQYDAGSHMTHDCHSYDVTTLPVRFMQSVMCASPEFVIK